ncbi:MAG: histidine phosphatase family protein [Acidimicrobiia bacterium]
MSAVVANARVVVVRHGETEWSRAGRHTSRTDVDLTDVGREQARAVGGRLSGYEFAEVWTSPMRRARETCRLAGFDRPVVERDLCEWDYGDFEGLTTAEIREGVPGWTVFTSDPPGGEDGFAVEQRVDRLVTRIRRSPGLVLCVAHGHLLRVLAARWLGLGAVDGCRFVLDPATLSVLGDERGVPAVLAWNSRPAEA